jgi:DNA mismatch endonuclease (patch repair protein)
MSRIKSKDTGIEVRVRSELHRKGLRFRKHVKELPGKPDIVFSRAKVAVFVDGDFWHGYQFRRWRETLSPFWQNKIKKNRERDCKNFHALRNMGWHVIRIWQHEIEHNLDLILDRIISAVKETTF